MIKITSTIIHSLYKSLTETNGASYNPQTLDTNPESGYMVAIPGYEYRCAMPMNHPHMGNIIMDFCTIPRVLDRLRVDQSIYIGLWQDDGKLIIDLAENVADEFDAITKGVARKQKAIYDCKAKEDIWMKGWETWDENTRELRWDDIL